MAIIAITGRKGGIGKSTITANLAAELVALGRSVAVLDTDPQKSLVVTSDQQDHWVISSGNAGTRHMRICALF